MTETGVDKRRLEVAAVTQGEDDTCRTFIIHEEDHTLGNALRYMVQKNPEVAFCGYSVPHPSENKINFRIQTKGKPANTCLRQGLEDVEKLCQHVLKTFQSSVEATPSQRSERDSQSEATESMDTS